MNKSNANVPTLLSKVLVLRIAILALYCCSTYSRLCSILRYCSQLSGQQLTLTAIMSSFSTYICL
uniref:Secreted protein n=1 Tax=Ascaris lumbricoides TaxID=6252 RepID=A0A0M3ISR7_ASCLU